MGRRKITEEAEQAKQTEQTTEATESSEDDRQQVTWRARKDLLGDLDEWAEQYDMSRNAAITMLVRQGLDER